MKIKLDENIPTSLVGARAGLGHKVDTVPSEGLAGSADDIVWKAAKSENRFFVTQDLDFSDVRKFTPRTHAGILVVRLRQPGKDALVNRILEIFHDEDISSLTSCFVEVR